MLPPEASSRVALFAQRLDRLRDLRRADHGLHARAASAIRRCQRLSAASVLGSVIGPSFGGGDDRRRALRSRRRPSRRSVSLSSRAGSSLRQLGRGSAGPVFSAERRRRRGAGPRAPIAIADRRRAAQRGADEGHQPRAAAARRPADPPAVDVGAEQGEHRRARRWSRRATLRTTTSATVPASEASSEPGTMKKATSIESSRVLPAKTVVRPAVRRVRARGLERLGPRRQLLAEARDHQQRVVDPQRQAHHRADGEREGVDVEPAGEDVEQPARGERR